MILECELGENQSDLVAVKLMSSTVLGRLESVLRIHNSLSMYLKLSSTLRTLLQCESDAYIRRMAQVRQSPMKIIFCTCQHLGKLGSMRI